MHSGRRASSRLPMEAHQGLMRAWLSILHDRDPNVTWVATNPQAREPIVDDAQSPHRLAA
jgi:hypothetical protein